MKIFIDSADLGEIREAVAMGAVDGCTTNPSLIAKTGKSQRQIIEAIVEVLDGPISAASTTCTGWRTDATRTSVSKA